MPWKKRNADEDWESIRKWLKGVGDYYGKIIKEYWIDPYYTPKKK